MTKLPIDQGPSRLDQLYAEKTFRQKALFRMFPGAKIRNTGGPSWDMHGPSAVLVVLHEEGTHGVHYDHELTLLAREIDKELARMREGRPNIGDDNTQKWPRHDHPVIQQNQIFDLLVSCACDEETWARDDVQDIHAKMFRKEPLDRIVEAIDD